MHARVLLVNLNLKIMLSTSRKIEIMFLLWSDGNLCLKTNNGNFSVPALKLIDYRFCIASGIEETTIHM